MPGYFAPPQSILTAFPPDKSGLFDAVRRQTSAKALDLIAEADTYGVEEYRAALQRLADGEDFSEGLPWQPHEVLSLTRLSAPGSTALEKQACLFACAAINRWGNANDESHDLEVIGPLDSCIALAPETLQRLYQQRLTHLLLSLDDPLLNDVDPQDLEHVLDLGSLGATLALTASLAESKTAGQREEAADWFLKIYQPIAHVWEKPFFVDGPCLHPWPFHAMAQRILDSGPWPPEQELVWSEFAKIEPRPQKVRRSSQRAKTAVKIAPALIPFMWRAWKEIRKGIKEKD